MSTPEQIAEADAKWRAYQDAPKFHHVIRELEGKLDRESYVYSTPAGSVELWRTPRPEGSTFFDGDYYGGVEVHSMTPQYPGQEPVGWHCQWTRSGECFTDGSSLAFERFEHSFDSPDYLKSALAGWHASSFNTEPEDES